jgi:RNA polymerase sigma factor (TIGR02999 family)
VDTLSTLFASAEAGDRTAADVLFAALYDELHRMARRELSKRGVVTLGATTVLHEAYLDMSGREDAAFPDRNRFMGYAARVMRGLIVDYARRRHAQKRGGQFEITSLESDVAGEAAVDPDSLSELSRALDGLQDADPRLARVVDLKYFCGFTFAEIAAMLDLTERTVQRDWEKARIYLHRALRDGGASQTPGSA